MKASPKHLKTVEIFVGFGNPGGDFFMEDQTLLYCVAIYGEPYSKDFFCRVQFELGDGRWMPLRSERRRVMAVLVLNGCVSRALCCPDVADEPKSGLVGA